MSKRVDNKAAKSAKKTKSAKKVVASGMKPAHASSTNLKSAEDRTDHRIPIQLLVDYKANGHYLFDFCKDLGTGGVFIQTKSPLPKGSHIDLTFTLPDSKETLRTSGEVIWVQQEVAGREDTPPGMGVQFAGFCVNQRTILQDFVSRYHGSRLTTENNVKKPA